MVSQEKINFTIDLLAAMTVDAIAEDTGRSSNEILPEFLLSGTGKALYDPSTNFWWNGPAYLKEAYYEELVSNKD